MLKLINAKITARKATKVRLQTEIPMINELIEKAREEGNFCVPININDYSRSTEALIKKSGYEVEYNQISWAHLGVAIDKNEKELMKIAKDAGVKILEVQ